MKTFAIGLTTLGILLALWTKNHDYAAVLVLLLAYVSFM